MKHLLFLFLLTGSLSLNFCTSTKQKTEEAANNTQADSAKIKNLADNFLAPPDSDYTGDYFQKYDNGIIKVRGFFRFGKKHGKWMYFFPNGTLWSEAFFENDKMHGEHNVYHENGQLYFTGQYNHGKAIGTWSFYDSTGVLAATKKYDSISPQPEKK